MTILQQSPFDQMEMSSESHTTKATAPAMSNSSNSNMSNLSNAMSAINQQAPPPPPAPAPAAAAAAAVATTTAAPKDCIETTIVDLGKIDLNEPKEKRKHRHHHRDRHKEAANELNEKVHTRMASLTDPEACFLKALLIDNEPLETTTTTSSDDDDNASKNKNNLFKRNNNINKETDEELRIALLRKVSQKLNDEMLFSVPKQIEDHDKQEKKKHGSSKHNKRNSHNYDTPAPPNRKSNHGLWLAHRDGVHPKKLISLAGRLFQHNKNNSEGGGGGGASVADEEPFPQSSQPQSQSQHQRQQPVPQNMTHATYAFRSMKSNRNRANSWNCSSGRGPRLHRNPGSSLRLSDRPPLPVSPRKSQSHRRALSGGSAASWSSGLYSYDSEDDYPSDEEVRPEVTHDQTATAQDDDSSWDSQWDASHREYDTWEVLKDEYATDFGFNYTDPGSSNIAYDDVPPDSFRILGTSPDDPECQPHVMSPPMLDALMSFLPENVLGQNFWIRFSLVRDGANLDTLKRYVRASKYTILAIETPTGEVFGSFTSSPWRNTYGFFGSTPAFVWKMRHSRQTPCSSLFEQAQLESEIDVFMADGYHDRIQVCRRDALAVGGDEDLRERAMADDDDDDIKSTDNESDDKNSSSGESSKISESGFAIALEDDLLRGTTSKCRTFHNPALCGNGRHTQVFDVSGLEVWTLTPCFDVKSAEKLEMTKFFLDEQTSIRSSNASSFPSEPSLGSRRGSSFLGNESLDQETFYRRVGHDPDSESRRDRWQYLNTMGGFVSDRKGLGASPRYG